MQDEQPLPTQEERTWAMIAHLSGLAGWVVGVGQLVVPLVLYLVHRERSRFVAFHALQQLFFQPLLLVVLAVIWVVGYAIGLLTCGLGLFVIIPLAGLVLLGLGIYAIVYIVWSAIEAYNGNWFRLPWVSEWALSLTQT